MSNRLNYSPLGIENQEFLVARMIEQCPKTMMSREMLKNALEAATLATGEKLVKVFSTVVNGANKLTFFNTGPGMDSNELLTSTRMSSSINKVNSLDGNFGSGGKISALASNRLGIRYRSCKNGIVSQVVLLGEKKNGQWVYGRQRANIAGEWGEVYDVTHIAKREGFDLSYDWTEVVLMGNRPDQDTCLDPYGGDPKVLKNWLVTAVYHRFFSLPEGVKVTFSKDLTAGNSGRTAPTFASVIEKTQASKPGGYSMTETVGQDSEVRITYLLDDNSDKADLRKASAGAMNMVSTFSVCGLVYKDEIYSLRQKQSWAHLSPRMGIPYGYQFINIFVHLPDDYPVQPDGTREFLRYVGGDQKQVDVADFADLVVANRPDWLIGYVAGRAPKNINSEQIREDWQKLMDDLRLRDRQKLRKPRATPDDDPDDDEGEEVDTRRDPSKKPPNGPRLKRREAPRLEFLTTKEQVKEFGGGILVGRAAQYVDASHGPGTLYVNGTYAAFADLREMLQQEYASATDQDLMRTLTKDHADRHIIARLGKVVVRGLAKANDLEWDSESCTKYFSMESLCAAADDYLDGLTEMRRAITKKLGVSGAAA